MGVRRGHRVRFHESAGKTDLCIGTAFCASSAIPSCLPAARFVTLFLRSPPQLSMLRFALIGTSRIAQKHAEAIRLLEDAELAAVCDLNPARAESLAAKYCARSYIDYHRMLGEEPIDVIIVATPSGDHARTV